MISINERENTNIDHINITGGNRGFSDFSAEKKLILKISVFI